MFDVKLISLDEIIFPQIDIVGITIGIGKVTHILAVYIPPDLHAHILSDFVNCLSFPLLFLWNHLSQSNDQVDILNSNDSINTNVLRSLLVQLRDNVNYN